MIRKGSDIIELMDCCLKKLLGKMLNFSLFVKNTMLGDTSKISHEKNMPELLERFPPPFIVSSINVSFHCLLTFYKGGFHGKNTKHRFLIKID